jgi:hypothetical protein
MIKKEIVIIVLEWHNLKKEIINKRLNITTKVFKLTKKVD